MTTNGSVALVTGATSGIGSAVALELARRGFRVVGTGRNVSKAVPISGVTFMDLDVTSDASVDQTIRQVLDQFGRIDVLVNNAGVGSAGAAEENDVRQSQQVFDVNFFGVVRMTGAVLPHMRERGSGRIINVSSVLGFLPAPFGALYSASKHAVEGYSESVDHEVRQHGVRVLLVEPSFIKTAFEASIVKPARVISAYSNQSAAADDVVASGLKNGDTPERVAQTIVAAATEKNPRLRYLVGKQAGQLAALRRYAPRGFFDSQFRKNFKLPK